MGSGRSGNPVSHKAAPHIRQGQSKVRDFHSTAVLNRVSAKALVSERLENTAWAYSGLSGPTNTSSWLVHMGSMYVGAS